jgi:hypothetical protein
VENLRYQFAGNNHKLNPRSEKILREMGAVGAKSVKAPISGRSALDLFSKVSPVDPSVYWTTAIPILSSG